MLPPSPTSTSKASFQSLDGRIESKQLIKGRFNLKANENSLLQGSFSRSPCLRPFVPLIDLVADHGKVGNLVGALSHALETDLERVTLRCGHHQ